LSGGAFPQFRVVIPPVRPPKEQHGTELQNDPYQLAERLNSSRGIDNFTNFAGLAVGILFGVLMPLDTEALEALPAPGEQ
jgi:hypothetical protein